ncbi:MAG TPA: putative DNA modification/repair radical SAM protein, partial [Clostridiales bacterium UBA8960]|nr:putative DNA modification/repair radical SAM protein [Clostridiales bacterium UBA8960]
MEPLDKLKILADAAKYDVSCSSSGSDRKGSKAMLGNTALPGVCHSFAEDGRCISLLKILYTNKCIYDCAYCLNRSSNTEISRAEFTPDELVDITISFYRRNYIEGLFLSSGVVKNPNYTMEMLIRVVKRLRTEERFNGYIHLKGIPGADATLIETAGRYVDRMSINIELPTTRSLRLLAPEKSRSDMIAPMGMIKERISEYKALSQRFKNTPTFVPAGQSTQLIVGATDDVDLKIIKISEALYNRMSLKRVYYSAYIPVGKHEIASQNQLGLLKREHRIYQADWLMRFYGFKADEILTVSEPNLDLEIDPKAQWALRNLHLFPVEVNKVSFMELLRVPGIGNITARRIVASRKFGLLSYDALAKMGVVLKRA